MLNIWHIDGSSLGTSSIQKTSSILLTKCKALCNWRRGNCDIHPNLQGLQGTGCRKRTGNTGICKKIRGTQMSPGLISVIPVTWRDLQQELQIKSDGSETFGRPFITDHRNVKNNSAEDKEHNVEILQLRTADDGCQD